MDSKTIIFIFGGGLVKNTDGSWRTTNYAENGRHGALGDRIRVIAAAYLFKEFAPVSNPLVIASGGFGTLSGTGAPPVGDVIAKELEILEVPKNHIEIERETNSTYDELNWLAGKIEKQDNYELKKIFLVSNRYHIPRIRAMIECFSKLSFLKELLDKNIILIESAEEIVLKHDPLPWGPIIEQAYVSANMRERVLSEESGVKDIKMGKYQFRGRISIRPATVDDIGFLFQLRNEKEVRESSWNTDPISYETHQAWVSRSLVNPNRVLFIAEAEGVPAGQVRYDFDDAKKTAEVSVSFLREFRGKGFGSEALERTASAIFVRYPELTTLYAHIKLDNAGSVGSFAKAGYIKTEKTEYEGHLCVEMIFRRP